MKLDVYEGGKLSEYRMPEKKPLDGGSEPPDFTIMEQRVADLERRMDRVETKLDRLIEVVSDLRSDIRHLPGKGFVITTVVSVVGLVIAAIALAPYLRVPAT